MRFHPTSCAGARDDSDPRPCLRRTRRLGSRSRPCDALRIRLYRGDRPRPTEGASLAYRRGRWDHGCIRRDRNGRRDRPASRPLGDRRARRGNDSGSPTHDRAVYPPGREGDLPQLRRAARREIRAVTHTAPGHLRGVSPSKLPEIPDGIAEAIGDGVRPRAAGGKPYSGAPRSTSSGGFVSRLRLPSRPTTTVRPATANQIAASGRMRGE